MINYKLGRDRNGNRVLKVRSVYFPKVILIQTNGTLPKTHADGIGPWTQSEVSQYVKTYGTKRQKQILGF